VAEPDAELNRGAADIHGGTVDEQRAAAPDAELVKRARGRLDGGRQVIHRMAEPAGIAGAVAMVASDEAGWITGQSILANGGNAFSI
jgi:NAD(P)-dependent dehydrogenase (short-subunit alcohol dehydrogenase family)